REPRLLWPVIRQTKWRGRTSGFSISRHTMILLRSPAGLSVLPGDNCGRKVPMCRGQDNPGRCLRADCLPDGQREAGVEAMARDRVKVWYDAKGDYLEVLFDQRPGYFRETANEQVMEKVDAEGNVLGFSVLKVSGIGAEPLEVAL